MEALPVDLSTTAVTPSAVNAYKEALVGLAFSEQPTKNPNVRMFASVLCVK